MNTWRRRATALGLLVALLISLLAAVSGGGGQPVQHYAVPGLHQPVHLVVDRWGVPHIYARDTEDLFLAQGFNAARARTFQLDLWLRRGLGRLAEAFGPEFADQDRAARLFLYRGDMKQEWDSYGPDARVAATRFADGVNAYLSWLEDNPKSLPEEFQRLGHRPARWTAEDVVRIRSHGPSRNVTSEVARARMSCVADPRSDKVRARLEPDWNPVVPAGLDPCAIPEDVLRDYDLAVELPEFTGTAMMSRRATKWLPAPQGSNNWAVGPTRTTTGRPLVANDPHREFLAPSLRYLAHLSAPGINVIGAGEPSAPGISLGHNGNVAFGITIAGIDQEDLYVYDLDPADPTRYRYGTGWEKMTLRGEQVAVAGQAPRAVTLAFTRHGPVIKTDPVHHKAYAVRTVWLQPGTSPYFGSIANLRSSTAAEFDSALNGWKSPSLNQVYADTQGNIGWTLVGLAPRRPNHDGLLPVPGDGRYEWDGFHPSSDLPRTANPASGIIATANNYTLPPDYPARERKLGFEWVGPARRDRIQEVLTAKPQTSVEDSTRLQNDRVSLVARRITALLAALSTEDSVTATALQVMRGWDGDESTSSTQATLFEVWFTRYLGSAFVRAVLPPKAADAVPFGVPDYTVLLEALENPLAWFGPDGIAKRDQLLLTTLGQAYVDASNLLGPDMNRWRWGDVHKVTFGHPASARLTQSDPPVDVGPFPQGGSWNTVNLSFFHPFSFQSGAGPSVRLVMDVGNWDASQAINAPGQSGDHRDPNYRDLAPKWNKGEYFPLLYTRSAVEKHAQYRIQLNPKK
ncbi:penicillin acylase family protein [Streptoalloteichus hindustanus]|uniref:Penicillin amidase n=1 Tax=Streptoalloteichus hindustanus TaxID=2017 RepID=A0A1M5HZ79_STRHI|nr:penicillin acylase family protein [Streptoalloteichus hindustanus]SHG21257.1 penicillin amidase [Streptoalloteichus hindustanus]